MNYNEEEFLELINRLLERLHQADFTNQGSNVINIYASGSQHIECIHTRTVNGNVYCQHEAQELSPVEQRVRHALEVLKQEQLLSHLYDYTWVMGVMNDTDGLPCFSSPQSFLTYLEGLGLGQLPDSSTISKKNNSFSGTFPNWTFTDSDITEANRRINIGKRFLSLYRKG